MIKNILLITEFAVRSDSVTKQFRIGSVSLKIVFFGSVPNRPIAHAGLYSLLFASLHSPFLTPPQTYRSPPLLKTNITIESTSSTDRSSNRSLHHLFYEGREKSQRVSFLRFSKTS